MSKKFAHYRTTRKLFLEGVKGRLENDVAPYLDLINQIASDSYLKTGKTEVIGFWALVRMVLPPINAVANALYRGKENDKFCKLLKQLGIAYPRIVLEMYRHSLMHNDELRGIAYRGQRIGWSIGHGGTDHIFHKDAILIDIRKLYQDFIKFLNAEIAKSGSRTVWAENTVVFGKGIPTELKKEFDDIKSATNP